MSNRSLGSPHRCQRSQTKGLQETVSACNKRWGAKDKGLSSQRRPRKRHFGSYLSTRTPSTQSVPTANEGALADQNAARESAVVVKTVTCSPLAASHEPSLAK